MGENTQDMTGKYVLVTGANSGIGFETARQLSAQGAVLIAACRDRKRGQKAIDLIRQEYPSARIEFLALDLANLESVREAAREVKDRFPRLDVLINNAGLISPTRRESAQGHELQFAVNHLGHFLLTHELIGMLSQTGQGRIIVVSSGAHWAGSINFDDLMLRNSYSAFKAYAQSKLANILFVRELASRPEAAAIKVNALHPGFVRTSFASDRDSGSQAGWMKWFNWAASSPQKGAETSVWLAMHPEGGIHTGGYFARCKPAGSSSASKDMALAARLWEVSGQLTGIA